MTSKLELISSNKVYGGYICRFKLAESKSLGGLATVFAVYLPPSLVTGPDAGLLSVYKALEECKDGEEQQLKQKVAGCAKKTPVLFWLSGLTCTDENFVNKAGAFEAASKANVMLVCPDTSPRGAGVAGEDDSYDFGSGAGFYVDATNGDWAKNYHMYSFVTKELVELITECFPGDKDRMSIFGHSMGGHGALVCALKNPGMYKSVSCFAPICSPSNCPWGEKAFTGYLGSVQAGAEYDASLLAVGYSGPKLDILVDQGDADNFLHQKQLLPENLSAACEKNGGRLNLKLRMQEGYDHSYFFISTFVKEHVEFHNAHLK
eukprot:Nk52_evm37s2496 gene=Nk52_evmTU37s2496